MKKRNYEKCWFVPWRQWQLALLIFTFLAVLTSSFAVVFVEHIQRQKMRELQFYMVQEADLDREWTQLLVEYNAWSALDYIEKEASQRLGMLMPSVENVTFIEYGFED